MSLRLFFARHSSKALLFVSFSLTSCARKNTRVYNFCSAPPLATKRVDLPYLGGVQSVYDAVQQQFNLTWQPISTVDIPNECALHGYNVYVGTALKLFSRQPLLRLPAQAQACEFVMQQQLTPNQLFGVAPVFHDQQKNEIIGLVTIAKLKSV